MVLELYVDGSWSKNNPGVTLGGIVILKDKNIVHLRHVKTYIESFVRSNNVGGELLAALIGIMDVCNICNKEKSIVNIYYDYNGVKDFLTDNFTPRKESSIIYVNAIQHVLNENTNVTLYFHKVKSHSGNVYNNLADRVASGVSLGEYRDILKDTITL